MSKRIAQSVSLTPELDRFVQDQVASGRYQTFSEVVRDAARQAAIASSVNQIVSEPRCRSPAS